MPDSTERGGSCHRLAARRGALGPILAAWRDAPGRRRRHPPGTRCPAALLVASLAVPAAAQGTKVKVGVLELSSSAPILLGVERGTFRDFGIEPELVYFQAAQPVAVAIAAGEIEVGATGLTAGLYNVVAGGDKVWVVADKGREWPGHPLTALLVQKDGPIRSVRDLRGRKVGMTQLGSTFHAALGRAGDRTRKGPGTTT